MKTLLIISTCFTLICCAGQNNEITDNNNSVVITEESFACRICLLEDSIETLERELVLLKALNAHQEKINTLNKALSNCNIIIRDWKSKDSISFKTATLDCAREHGFISENLDLEQRDNLMIYYAYNNCAKFIYFDKAYNKNEINKEGKYSVWTKKGELILSEDTFNEFIKNKEKRYNDMIDYKNQKINNVSKKMSRNLQERSKSFYLMADLFSEDVLDYYKLKEKACQTIANDKEYQKLISEYDDYWGEDIERISFKGQ